MDYRLVWELRFSCLDDVEARQIFVKLRDAISPSDVTFLVRDGTRVVPSAKLQRLREGKPAVGIQV